MSDLDNWCGPYGVWTQLSQWHIIAEGGTIDVAELSPEDLEAVLVSLRAHAGRHEVWRPVAYVAEQAVAAAIG